ncbi:hypothetical protein B0T25DRAFT_365020 [Lasiosphaeria hispida]|uniref:Secreted protein n=1 Tax=Lasiosphaeria hispida TaxID=260671 RepID=A0AAJ0M7U5_9PEZI|nr:hypothetical protein B0T25DRAFT_365020 [Lasiosphaeria hispida]
MSGPYCRVLAAVLQISVYAVLLRSLVDHSLSCRLRHNNSIPYFKPMLQYCSPQLPDRGIRVVVESFFEVDSRRLSSSGWGRPRLQGLFVLRTRGASFPELAVEVQVGRGGCQCCQCSQEPASSSGQGGLRWAVVIYEGARPEGGRTAG